MRILIVKLSSIGDVVHTLPVLHSIKKALPEAEVSWVVEKRAAEILRGNPLIHDLIVVDTRSGRKDNRLRRNLKVAGRHFGRLRKSEFDLSIDFQGLLKSASIGKLTKTKKRFGFSKRNLREPASRVFLSRAIDVEPKQNVINKNLDLAEDSLRDFLGDDGFCLPRDEISFPIETAGIHKREAEKLVGESGHKFAILNPAGGWWTKLWPAERFGQLADLIWSELGIVPLISTAPSEKELAEKVAAGSESARLIKAIPSLKGFYELARRSEFYVGGDTAPTHLAVAADCPVVGIFGPTEWWRNGSINNQDICVERNDIECRIECHRRSCDKWICMDIDVERVFEAIVSRLGLNKD